MAPVHDRMPVLLAPGDWAQWLDPKQRDTGRLLDLFDLGDDRSLTMHAVSTEVNNVRNNRAELIEPGSIGDS